MTLDNHDDLDRALPEAYRRIYGDDAVGREVEGVGLESVAAREAPEGADVPRSAAEVIAELLAQQQLRLILPTEAFVHFYPASPEQVINAAKKAGFAGPYFENLGDELVAQQYLERWHENIEKRTWIRSTSPLVVEYCRARHPQLLPLLAPFVSPPVALVRYLKTQFGDDTPVVYCGLDAPGPDGLDEFAAVMTFTDLAEVLELRDSLPADQPVLLSVIPPTRQRYLSTAGGLPLQMLDEERMSSRTFRKVRGLHALDRIARLVEEDGQFLGFIDVLPFDGPVDHPALGPSDELYWRLSLLELAEPPRSTEPVIVAPEELDLAVTYEPRDSTPHETEIDEVARLLTEAGSGADESLWRGDPVGFASYLSLADSMMRGRPELALGMVQMSRNYNRAVRDATHDHLTNLYSYRALVQRVHEEMGQANRSGSTLGMLFIDLDSFKAVNDTFGHAAGNELLRSVADVMRNTIRGTDIAGRFGGDEFVLLLVAADRAGAVRVAEQIRQRIAQINVSFEGEDFGTTASVGLAFHDGSERSLMSADDLFAEADASLYIAKAHGGNRVHPVVREGAPS